MSQASDPPTPELESGEAIARRKLLKQAGWVLPAIVTTVTVTGRAAQATCTPRCAPAAPTACNPLSCNPASCNPAGGPCQPSNCKPRR